MRAMMISVLMWTAGCAHFVSWDDLGRSWVGEPIEKIIDSWGNPDQVSSQGSGEIIYKYRLRSINEYCIHYWVVNEAGIIKDFYHEGYCRPIG